MNNKKLYDRCFEIFVVIMFVLYLVIPKICNANNDLNSSKHKLDNIVVIKHNNKKNIRKKNIVKKNITKFVNYPYTVSCKGKQFIKDHESLELKAYNDPTPKKRSIGWGHQIQPGENYNVITEATANKLFESDIKKTEASVNRLLKQTNPKFKYTQNFIDGIASLVYNCGEYGVSQTPFYQRLLKCRPDNSDDCINEADLNFALAAVKTSKVFCKAHKVRRTNEYKLMTSEIYSIDF